MMNAVPTSFVLEVEKLIHSTNNDRKLFFNNKTTRGILCERCGIQDSMVSKYIKRCVDNGILNRTKDRGIYVVSPWLLNRKAKSQKKNKKDVYYSDNNKNREGNTMIRYRDGILQALKDIGYSSARLRKERIFGERTIQEFRHQSIIPSVTLNRLCTMLNCQIQDVIEFIPDDTQMNQPKKSVKSEHRFEDSDKSMANMQDIKPLNEDVIRNIITTSTEDYDSAAIIENECDGKKIVTRISTQTTMLCHLPQGMKFKIGDLEFVKLETFKNGTTLILQTRGKLGKYGEKADYLESDARMILHEKLLPIIENNIGATYIKPHYTDYTDLKMMSGRVVNDNSKKSLILERIGLLSYYDCIKYKDFIPSEIQHGWLSNRRDCRGDFVLVITNKRNCLRKSNSSGYIFPVLTVDSSRIVKTRVLFTYSV